MFSRFSSAGPMPGSRRTGQSASTDAASDPSTANPRGLSSPAASLASRRFGAKPIETVRPTSASTCRAKRASTAAGGAPCSACVPDKSTTASSIESGCTSGERCCISMRMARDAAVYFAKSGRMTTASGQALSALNIGMAERQPYIRAT